jgi:hypothetical protein
MFHTRSILTQAFEINNLNRTDAYRPEVRVYLHQLKNHSNKNYVMFCFAHVCTYFTLNLVVYRCRNNTVSYTNLEAYFSF